MTVKINFSKIQKCDQIWDDMPVCDSGRLCQQCDRVIHDFRGMTDWNIAVKHANSSSKVCGIYDEQTLSGKSQSRTVPLKKGRKALWAATMAGLTSITTINAQAHGDKSESVHIVEKDTLLLDPKKDKNVRSSQDTLKEYKQLTIKGKLMDSSDKTGMIGGNVFISGTDKGTISDFNGYYSLDISSELAEQDSVTLLISYLGYTRIEKTIHLAGFEKNKPTLVQHFELKEEEGLVFAVYTRPPWYKRVWNKIKNVFR